MIDVLFSLDVLAADMVAANLPDGSINPRKAAYCATGSIWVTAPPECREVDGRIMIHALVPDASVITMIESDLASIDTPIIIGVWDQGTGARDTNYPWRPDLYALHLADIVEYDADGVEISRRRPTEAEAMSTQINKFAGPWPDRILA